MKFIVLCILVVGNLFGVITIAPAKIGDKPGFSGVLKGSLETKRGNSDVDNYSAGLRAKYDSNTSYLLWSDFTFSYGKASGEINTNKTYAHVRYLHTFFDISSLNYEAFVQSETNEFTNVADRLLLGGGLRYNADLKEYGNVFIGLGGFYENIRYLTLNDPKEKNSRLNSYISYTKSFDKDSKLSYVLYYQPKLEEVSDYIFSNGFELQVLIYESFYLNFVLYYDIDSKPAFDVKESDFTQKTSFIYKF
ncbi:MAG: DUF481 domain-containing protein [Campylobacterota bacterium]|nr:DUF481 domain-containing protein [Campylobacterota bacterium]